MPYMRERVHQNEVRLTTLKRLVHGCLDHIWREAERAGVPRHVARGRCYSWLAENLDIPTERCHVAQFDVPACLRALTFLRRGGVYYSWEDVKA